MTTVISKVVYKESRLKLIQSSVGVFDRKIFSISLKQRKCGIFLKIFNSILKTTNISHGESLMWNHLDGYIKCCIIHIWFCRNNTNLKSFIIRYRCFWIFRWFSTLKLEFTFFGQIKSVNSSEIICII